MSDILGVYINSSGETVFALHVEGGNVTVYFPSDHAFKIERLLTIFGWRREGLLDEEERLRLLRLNHGHP